MQINYSKRALIASSRLLPLTLSQVFEEEGLFISARSFELVRFLISRLAALFFKKKNKKNIRFLQMRSRAAPVTEISDFAIEISVLELKIFQYEHSSLGEFFDKTASLSQHSGRNGIIFVWYVFPLQR